LRHNVVFFATHQGLGLYYLIEPIQVSGPKQYF